MQFICLLLLGYYFKSRDTRFWCKKLLMIDWVQFEIFTKYFTNYFHCYIPPSKPKVRFQQVAAWASEDGGSPEGFTHGCRPCKAARGGPPFCIPCCCCWGTPNPLLNASACRDSINRFAAWRSASRSSAVCLLRRNY